MGVLVFDMAFLPSSSLKNLGFISIGDMVAVSEYATFHNPNTISIGSNVRIDDFVVITGKVEIGNFVHIGSHCSLLASDGRIELGDFSGLAPGCRLFTGSDDYTGEMLTNPTIPHELRRVKSGDIVVKEHAILGASSVVLPGVVIHEGASIGALSLVSKDLGAWTINVGSPCRKIGDRKTDLLSLVERVADYSEKLD